MSEPELLFPALPIDIAVDCLLRVPLHRHSSLSQVCRSWRSLVSAPAFMSARHSLGYTDHYACLIQAAHAPPSSANKSPPYAISVYDSRRHSWHRLPPIPDLAGGALPLFCRCATVGCRLVLLGGLDPSSCAVLKSVYVYDFASGLWRKGSSMPSARSFFSCAALGGSIVVAGGHDDNKTALRTAAMYDVQRDVWEPLPDMHEERDECKAVLLGGKLAVVSGFATDSQGQFGRNAEVYSPEEKAWTLMEGMWPAGVAPSSLSAVADQLIACFDSKLMRYKEKEAQWEPLMALPEAVRAPACVTPLRDSLLITGFNAGTQQLEAFQCGVGTPPYACRKLDVCPSFSGIVQGGCTMEI